MKGEDLSDIPENIIYRKHFDSGNQKAIKSSFLIESLLSNNNNNSNSNPKNDSVEKEIASQENCVR
jgi:hypothetical protein